MSTAATRMKILRTNEVADMLGVSRVTLWRWCRLGLFVPKRFLGPNSVGFLESDVEEWLTTRPSTGTDLDEEPGKVQGGY